MRDDMSYVAIEGPIGAGKTSLAKKLAEHFNAELVLEEVEDNALLGPFYRDTASFAFSLQLFFLVHRSEQQRLIRKLREDGKRVVSDYVFAKDDLFAKLVLSKRQYSIYGDVVRELRTPHVRPDLVIYLHASVDELVSRIAKRGRKAEEKIGRDYIQRVAEAYESFFSTYDRTALLRVDTEKRAPAVVQEDFEWLLGEIEKI